MRIDISTKMGKKLQKRVIEHDENLKTSVTWIFFGPLLVFFCRLDNHSANYPNMACNRTLRRCEMWYWMTWALNSVQFPTWATNICQAWFWQECALFKRCLDCFLWLRYCFGDCYELLVFNQLWGYRRQFFISSRWYVYHQDFRQRKHWCSLYLSRFRCCNVFKHKNRNNNCRSLYNNYRVRSSQISKKSLKKISSIPNSYCSAVNSCQMKQIYQWPKYILRV